MAILGEQGAGVTPATTSEIVTAVMKVNNGHAKSVCDIATNNGITTLDARQSTYGGNAKGATDGLHRYNITTKRNTVDMFADRTPIQIGAGSNVEVNGAEVKKTDASNSWNASFYSEQAMDPNAQDFAVSWEVESVTGTIREMAGLDDAPTANQSYSSGDYFIYQVNNNFHSAVYEEGAAIKIPNYTNFTLQVGDRLFVKCVENVVYSGVLRGQEETVLYTSQKKATSALKFKGALNRGQGQSGHSVMTNVEWHNKTKAVLKQIQIMGAAGQELTQDHIELLKSAGMTVQSGATYDLLSFERDSSAFFQNSEGAAYGLDVTHAYLAGFQPSTGTISF